MEAPIEDADDGNIDEETSSETEGHGVSEKDPNRIAAVSPDIKRRKVSSAHDNPCRLSLTSHSLPI